MNGEIGTRKKNNFPKAPLVFCKNYFDQGDDVCLWDDRRTEIERCFSEQARQCVDALWGKTVPIDNNGNRRALIKIIWQLVSHHVFYLDEKEAGQRYLFLLGKDDLNQYVVSKKYGIAMIEGAAMALPFDKKSRTFYLDLPEDLVFPYPIHHMWRGDVRINQAPINQTPVNADADTTGRVIIKPGKKKNGNGNKPYKPTACEYDTSWNAEKALFTTIEPHVAAWWLEQQEEGRRYIYRLPKDEWKSNNGTNPPLNAADFRKAARKACIDKWGDVISPVIIKEYFREQEIVNSKEQKSSMDVHHRELQAWGGRDDSRTYIDRDFHFYIHADFNKIQKEILDCLGLDGEFIPDAEYFEKLFAVDPSKADDLMRIPNVTVKDDVVGIKILWPSEIYCIPSLLRFEIQNQGTTVSKDRKREIRKMIKRQYGAGNGNQPFMYAGLS